MGYCRVFFAVFIILISSLTSVAQNGYRGKEFWIAFPQNAIGKTEYPLEQTLHITGPEGTQGVVKELLTGNEYPFTIGAIGSWKCSIDTTITVISEGIHKAGIQIAATEDISVLAVSHRKASTDTYVAIPVERLGKEYAVIGYDPVSAGNLSFATQFEVVATANDTKVTIRYPAAVVFDTTPRIETLQRGQVLHVGGKVAGSVTSDLTGTIIESDKPVAVITGHTCAQVPPGHNYCDFLIEMLPPASALGTEHIVARLSERERSTVRVLAIHNGTEVSVDGKRKLLLNRGEYYQDEQLKNNALIKTTHPAYVMQFGHSSDDDANKIADPFIMLVAPTDKYVTEVDLIVPTFKKTQDEIEHEQIFNAKPPEGPITSADGSTTTYPNKSMTIPQHPDAQQDATPTESGWVHWLNLITTADGIDKLKLDGQPVVPNLFKQVGTSNYYVAHIKTLAGRHKLKSDVPFVAYLYGYGKGGANFDSYGHLCGQKLD